MSVEEPIDVGAILGQLRTEIRSARATLADDTPHAAQLGVSFDELRDAIVEVEALRAVSAHWPLTWRTPRERVQVFVQRLIRRGLKWYIAPIVEQQNAYNNAVARMLQLLLESYQQLSAEVAQLQATQAPTPAEQPNDQSIAS